MERMFDMRAKVFIWECEKALDLATEPQFLWKADRTDCVENTQTSKSECVDETIAGRWTVIYLIVNGPFCASARTRPFASGLFHGCRNVFELSLAKNHDNKQGDYLFTIALSLIVHTFGIIRTVLICNEYVFKMVHVVPIEQADLTLQEGHCVNSDTSVKDVRVQ